MIIKDPACYDVSHWERVPNFADVVPFPLLVICKATEGTAYHDPTFGTYITDARSDGIHDGAYHFFRVALNPVIQARFFCDYIRGEITDKTILILDMEESGCTAGQMWAWFEQVRATYPANPLMLYSRKNLLDPIPMTASEAAYFRQIPTWIAGYPMYPDNFTSPPPMYIPDQAKYGPVWLWQYSDAVFVQGIEGAVDVNWIAPQLINLLGEPTKPPVIGEPMLYGKVISTVNVRTQPNTSASIVGALQVGQMVKASAENAGWWQIAEVDGVPQYVGNWCAQNYNGKIYIQPVTEPPYTGTETLNLSLTLADDGTVAGTWRKA